MNTLPPRPDQEVNRAAAIGKSVVIKGQLFSREDLFIDGEIEGSVEMVEHKLTVGLNGKLTASIKAREVVVLGTIHGNVEATDRIEIKKDAKLVGDIRTGRIAIEDGAFFKGAIDIKSDNRAQAPRQMPVSAPAASGLSAPAAASAAAGDKR